MKFLLTIFFCSVSLVLGQTTQKFSNIQLTATPAESLAAGVVKFLQLDATGIGESVTPTVLWEAVVLTGTVDSTDLADGTTVGRSFVTLANPSAITFPRINANNTVTARTAAELKTDLSLGTITGVFSGSAAINIGEVTGDNGTTFEITVTGATTTGTPSVSLGWSALLPAGLIVTQAYVSSANTVTVAVYNPTSNPIDPDEQTVRATVIHF